MSGVAHDLCLIRSMRPTRSIRSRVVFHSGRRQSKTPLRFAAWPVTGLGTEESQSSCSVRFATNGLCRRRVAWLGRGSCPPNIQAVDRSGAAKPDFYLDNPTGRGCPVVRCKEVDQATAIDSIWKQRCLLDENVMIGAASSDAHRLAQVRMSANGDPRRVRTRSSQGEFRCTGGRGTQRV